MPSALIGHLAGTLAARSGVYRRLAPKRLEAKKELGDWRWRA